jgi:plastocyanin
MAMVRERQAQRGRIRLSICLGTVVLALGLNAPSAWAAAQPIGASDNVFTGGSGGSAPTYTMDQGDNPPFLTNNGPANAHNVQARQNGPDNGALFFSATTGPGTQAPVFGTQYLSAGSYQFFCTIHPEMQGTLVVTSNGTPQPRPSVALEMRTKKISKALRKGIVVGITPSPGPGITMQSLVAKLGKTTIGKAKFPDAGPHSPTNLIQLSKAGKSKLRKKGSAKVTVIAHVLFGSPTTTNAKLR